MNFLKGSLAIAGTLLCMAGPAVSHAAARDSLSAQFSICSNAPRVNCVVDGDTFWFRGQKIRIADIDTPELSPPRCVREAELGEAAKCRLLVLLNAGEFSLTSGLRDADRNGRKLRTVLRNGSSLGEIMISEGLARSWEGQRRSWCNCRSRRR